MKGMFFTFLVGVLLASQAGANQTKHPEAAAACPFKTKACENPHDSGSYCGALTVANAKAVFENPTARTK